MHARTAAALLHGLLAACSGGDAADAGPVARRIDAGVLRHPFEPWAGEVRVPNSSDRDWDVERVSASCGCVRVAFEPGRVPRGAELALRIVYDPRGMRGAFAHALTVHLASGDAHPLAELVGIVVPAPFAAPESLALGAAGGTTFELVLPWAEAGVDARAPAGVVVRELGRSERHGALVLTYEVGRSGARSPGEPQRLRLLVRGPGEAESEVAVPLIPSSGDVVAAARRGGSS
jgi:hypothetical protein